MSREMSRKKKENNSKPQNWGLENEGLMENNFDKDIIEQQKDHQTKQDEILDSVSDSVSGIIIPENSASTSKQAEQVGGLRRVIRSSQSTSTSADATKANIIEFKTVIYKINLGEPEGKEPERYWMHDPHGLLQVLRRRKHPEPKQKTKKRKAGKENSKICEKTEEPKETNKETLSKEFKESKEETEANGPTNVEKETVTKESEKSKKETEAKGCKNTKKETGANFSNTSKKVTEANGSEITKKATTEKLFNETKKETEAKVIKYNPDEDRKAEKNKSNDKLKPIKKNDEKETDNNTEANNKMNVDPNILPTLQANRGRGRPKKIPKYFGTIYVQENEGNLASNTDQLITSGNEIIFRVNEETEINGKNNSLVNFKSSVAQSKADLEVGGENVLEQIAKRWVPNKTGKTENIPSKRSTDEPSTSSLGKRIKMSVATDTGTNNAIDIEKTDVAGTKNFAIRIGCILLFSILMFTSFFLYIQ